MACSTRDEGAPAARNRKRTKKTKLRQKVTVSPGALLRADSSLLEKLVLSVVVIGHKQYCTEFNDMTVLGTNSPAHVRGFDLKQERGSGGGMNALFTFVFRNFVVMIQTLRVHFSCVLCRRNFLLLFLALRGKPNLAP